MENLILIVPTMAPLTYYLSLGCNKSRANFLPSYSGRWLETNIIFHIHPVALGGGKKSVFNTLIVAGLEHRQPHRQCWVTGRFLLCWGGYKRPPCNMDTHQQESFHCTPLSKSQAAFRAVIHWFLATNSLSPHHQFPTACTCPRSARFCLWKMPEARQYHLAVYLHIITYLLADFRERKGGRVSSSCPCASLLK